VKGRAQHDGSVPWPFGFLIKEWKTIKNAPLTIFIGTCILAFALHWLLDSGEIRAKNATIENLKEQLSAKTTTLVGGRPVQIMVYTNDPNAEGLVPDGTNVAALAYQLDGNGGMWSWDFRSRRWK